MHNKKQNVGNNNHNYLIWSPAPWQSHIMCFAQSALFDHFACRELAGIFKCVCKRLLSQSRSLHLHLHTFAPYVCLLFSFFNPKECHCNKVDSNDTNIHVKHQTNIQEKYKCFKSSHTNKPLPCYCIGVVECSPQVPQQFWIQLWRALDVAIQHSIHILRI